jgi:hypothetical protein
LAEVQSDAARGLCLPDGDAVDSGANCFGDERRSVRGQPDAGEDEEVEVDSQDGEYECAEEENQQQRDIAQDLGVDGGERTQRRNRRDPHRRDQNPHHEGSDAGDQEQLERREKPLKVERRALDNGVHQSLPAGRSRVMPDADPHGLPGWVGISATN